MIALRWNKNKDLVESFRCVGLTRKKDLTVPVEKSRPALIAEMQEGAHFQILHPESCRWEVGPALVLHKIRGQSYIKARSPATIPSDREKPVDEFPDLPNF